jgi:hypothetical protein
MALQIRQEQLPGVALVVHAEHQTNKKSCQWQQFNVQAAVFFRQTIILAPNLIPSRQPQLSRQAPD